MINLNSVHAKGMTDVQAHELYGVEMSSAMIITVYKFNNLLRSTY